ncbi:MATE family efflux transporter [Halalkalibacter lacteus]|uniref:MATE family efflux transporter n=1 Tax=Halalkalibacter lacteus TaxID=3090663 RepID=UPI002FC8A85D
MIPETKPQLQQQETVSHKDFLMLAVPLIVSTLTTPLLGAVDTAVVGHLNNPSYIGGVAVGALIFNTLYWLLGFLRVSTTGFSAQAHGTKNENEIQITFLRPLMIAVVVGILFILFQVPIKTAAISLINPSAQVARLAELYFDIRIWGAPFALLNYVILGWLIGTSRVKLALVLQVFMNVLNIVLDVLFVLVFSYGVAGVAAASLISEICGALIGVGIFLLIYKLRDLRKSEGIFTKAPFIKMLKMNRDLFIRTACLLTVFTVFTAQGAKMGEITLAVNAILLQIQFIIAYFFDGISNATSILVGRAVGEKNKRLYKRTIKLSAFWGFVASASLAAVLFIGKEAVIPLFTSIDSVQQQTNLYLIWMLLFPIAIFWGIQLNGIFSGATEAAPIRDSLIISMFVFLVCVWLFIPIWGNHGLWLAFTLFSLSRSLSLWVYLPRLQKVFS